MRLKRVEVNVLRFKVDYIGSCPCFWPRNVGIFLGCGGFYRLSFELLFLRSIANRDCLFFLNFTRTTKIANTVNFGVKGLKMAFIFAF